MSVYYSDERVTLHHGDALDVLRSMADSSVGAIVTDPPYGLGFMGREWDDLPPGLPWAQECLRVLKPGGHMLAFGGTRTWHRLACAVEDAGFEVRDSIAWLYGSGFPKSLDVSKAIDKAAPRVGMFDAFAAHFRDRRAASGLTQKAIAQHFPSKTGGLTGCVWNWENAANVPTLAQWKILAPMLGLSDEWRPLIERVEAEREVIAERRVTDRRGDGTVVGLGHAGNADITAPATPDAERWQGWGTALKPSHEPVVVARKPAGPTAILDTIGSQLGALEEACRRRVSGAARSSARTRADSSVARTATAPASAATPHEDGQEPITPTGAAASSSAATVTSASEWTAETFLSTVTSWRECLAEIYEATSTSTTSTATSRTTDLQTLSSCLSSIMQSVTAQSTLDPRSWSSLATAADNLFAAGVLSSRSTLALSAIESATASTPHVPQAAGGSSAFEPIVVARKPLTGTVAGNVLAHGTGALNIDACRVGTDGGTFKASKPEGTSNGIYGHGINGTVEIGALNAGRWPTNVVLDDSQAAALDEQSGERTSGSRKEGTYRGLGYMGSDDSDYPAIEGDTGGASRFFPTFRYEAKAPATERPRIPRNVLRLRADLTPAQVDHVRARLTEAGVQVD